MLAKINSDNKYTYFNFPLNLEEFRKRKQMDTENKRLAINNNWTNW